MTDAVTGLQATPPRPKAVEGPAARDVVVVGNFAANPEEQLRVAAERGGAGSLMVSSVEEARLALADPENPPPRCIFVHANASGLSTFVHFVRGEARLFSVPVVICVPAPSEAAYCQAHALGADDVVIAGDAGGFTRRTANLAEFDPAARPPLTQGRAIVAHQDGGRRRVLGRILRQSGFDVSFAADAGEAGERAIGPTSALLVVARDLPPGGGWHAVDRIRAAAPGVRMPAVVLVPERETESYLEIANAMGEVDVGSDLAPADNLLFQANELLHPDVRNVRASTRVLHDTFCTFRRAGSFERVYGLTYNISREGLYIRTLDPPARGTHLWLEMRPPGSTHAVQLRGDVVWTRGLRSPGGAAPPGFGLRLTEADCASADLAAYHEGYDGLLERLGET